LAAWLQRIRRRADNRMTDAGIGRPAWWNGGFMTDEIVAPLDLFRRQITWEICWHAGRQGRHVELGSFERSAIGLVEIDARNSC
jgi:hypothetical protein